MVEFENQLRAIVLNLEEDNVGVVLLGPSNHEIAKIVKSCIFHRLSAEERLGSPEFRNAEPGNLGMLNLEMYVDI